MEEYKVGDTLVKGDTKIRIKTVNHKPLFGGKIKTYYSIRYLAPKEVVGMVANYIEPKDLEGYIKL